MHLWPTRTCYTKSWWEWMNSELLLRNSRVPERCKKASKVNAGHFCLQRYLSSVLLCKPTLRSTIIFLEKILWRVYVCHNAAVEWCARECGKIRSSRRCLLGCIYRLNLRSIRFPQKHASTNPVATRTSNLYFLIFNHLGVCRTKAHYSPASPLWYYRQRENEKSEGVLGAWSDVTLRKTA